MKKVLIAYATNAGSTAEVADMIKTGLASRDLSVEIKPIADMINPAGYDAVIVGGPMIMGWHRDAGKFLKKNQAVLSKVPVACFLTAMSLTETGERHIDGIPIQVDPGLAKPPHDSHRLSFKEKYALLPNYVRQILRAAPAVKPVSVGLFGGYMNLMLLSWWARLFVLLVIQAKPGDLRDEKFIRDWAKEIKAVFEKSWLK